MASFVFPFEFADDVPVRGRVELEPPAPFENARGAGLFRRGTLHVEGHPELEFVLYHSRATAAFMYLRETRPDPMLLELVGLSPDECARQPLLRLPGQLCLGAERSELVAAALKDVVGASAIGQTIARCRQQNVAVFPIAREGLKYRVAEAIHDAYGCYCDEIVLDAHHVFDRTVPLYNRKVEMTLFKDKDLDSLQKQNISVAFIADSISSGLVMREVIDRVKERFQRLERVEVVSPLATIRGLSRIARAGCTRGTKVRLHVFETLLNALPPDHYYSAHFPVPELHIRPDLASEYRAWWGRDDAGHHLADTACAGYGWSEAFYSPRKQIQMINEQLQSRHGLAIADVVRRSMR